MWDMVFGKEGLRADEAVARDHGTGAFAPAPPIYDLVATPRDRATAGLPDSVDLEGLIAGLQPKVEAYLTTAAGRAASEGEQDDDVRAHIVVPAIAEEQRRRGDTGEAPLPNTAAEDVFNVLRGAGPLQRYMNLPGVTDLFVDGRDPVYYERDGYTVETDLVLSEDEIANFVDRMQRQQGYGGVGLGPGNPRVTVRTSRYRIVAHHQYLSPAGSTLAVRVRPTYARGHPELIERGMFTASDWTLLFGLLRARLCGIIGGEVGAGKTTVAQAMIDALPENLRIITVEGPIEFVRQRRRFVQLEVREARGENGERHDAQTLIQDTRRMGGQVVVVGEVLGAEAFDMVDVLKVNTYGSLCTMHANSARDAVDRLETMSLLHPKAPPLEAIRRLIRQSITFIAIFHRIRVPDGAGSERWQRVLYELAEITGLEESGLVVSTVLRWQGGRLRRKNNFGDDTRARLAAVGVSTDLERDYDYPPLDDDGRYDAGALRYIGVE